MRELRKYKYLEEKKMYQYEIRKEKLNSWKEYCNVAASLNPWSHVYELATGKLRTNSIMTTLGKNNVTVTSSILDRMNTMLDHLITDDGEEENQHHKNTRIMIEEPIYTRDDAEFTQGEIKQTIECFNRKKAPGMDGITSDIFLRKFKKFPGLVAAIYNQCLKRGSFPKRWKIANIIPIAKPSKENSTESSKFHPISLTKIGGKVLEKLLIYRFNCHMYKNELLTDSQYEFTSQKSTTEACMEVKNS